MRRYKPFENKMLIDFYNEVSEKIKTLPKFLKSYYFQHFILMLISYFESKYLKTI